jgi:hypothetical protein
VDEMTEVVDGSERSTIDEVALRIESSESSSSGRRATAAASVRRSVLALLGTSSGSTSVPEFAAVPQFAAAAAMGRPMSGSALTCHSSLSSGERSPRLRRSSFGDRSLRPQGEEALASRGSSFADQAREESLTRLNRARSRQQSVNEPEVRPQKSI